MELKGLTITTLPILFLIALIVVPNNPQANTVQIELKQTSVLGN